MGSDLRLGVVVGLTAEARIARQLGWPVAVGGGTAAGAISAVQRLVDDGVRGLVSFGMAGGLDPALRPGALVVPTAVVVDGASYPTDPTLCRLLGGATSHSVLGADALVLGVAHKRRCHVASGAAAVDLESGAVARAARVHGMPFAVVRAICDPAHRALPPAAGASLNAKGAVSLWRMIGSLLRHPGQVPALIGLARDAATARQALLAYVRRPTPPRAARR